MRTLRAGERCDYHPRMAHPIARDLDLLVVGEINPDIVVTDPDPRPAFGQAERIVESVRLVIGSSACIAACGAARLGLRVAMVGVVGADALGRFMLEALAARGVDVSACRVVEGRPTGASVILGSPTDRAILTATGTIADTRAADVPPALLARARHVHVGSFYLQPALAAEVPALFRAAHDAGATTSLDPNWDPSERWNSGFAAAAAEADVLLPNAAEACRLSGIDDVAEAARELARRGRGGRAVIAVKLGPDGGLAVGPDGEVARVTPPVVDVVDTTGAGDSFDAGFLAAWLDGAPVAEALALAVACGSLSTRVPGGTDGQPDRAEAEATAARLERG
jgi:sugar/nucleoside kinase (ribokinase family)